MTLYNIPVLAKVGPVSWARFKAECADYHDRLAVELQTEFPTHLIQDFPDIIPGSTRQTILAARDEYVAHLRGMLATLHTLKGQPVSEQIATLATTPALNPDEEEGEWDDHGNTADDDNDAGEDEIPDPPTPRLAIPVPLPQNPQVHAPPNYPPPPGPPPAPFQHPGAPTGLPQFAPQLQHGMFTFQQVMQMMQAMQQQPGAVPVAPVAPAAPAPHVVTPTRYKIAMPAKYDGTTTRCMDFLAECENYFVMNPMTDEQQVHFALQLLEKGANMWKCTSLLAIDDQPGWATNWAHFRVHFEDRFRDKNEREKAVQELMSGSLKQTHSARDFIDRVQDKCQRARWDTPRQWMDVVKSGLKLDLARALAGRYPRHWEDFVEVVVTTDEDLQRQKGRENRTTSSSKRSGQAAPSGDRQPRMSQEEQERHQKEGLCFYCHEKGHTAVACPKKKKKDEPRKVAEVSAGEMAPMARVEEVKEMASDDEKGFGDGK